MNNIAQFDLPLFMVCHISYQSSKSGADKELNQQHRHDTATFSLCVNGDPALW